MPLSPNVPSLRASLVLTFHAFLLFEAISSGVVTPRVLSSLAFGATNPLPSFNQSPDTPSNLSKLLCSILSALPEKPDEGNVSPALKTERPTRLRQPDVAQCVLSANKRHSQARGQAIALISAFNAR